MTIFNGEIIFKEKNQEFFNLIFSFKKYRRRYPIKKNFKFHGAL